MAPVVSTKGPGVTLPVCKDIQEVQMSDEKEWKLVLPKSLRVALWVAAIGLVLNGVQPLLSTQASANPNQVHKIAICSQSGEQCAQIMHSGKMENPNVTYMELRSIKQWDTAVSLFSQICSASSVFTPVKGGELERLCLFSCSFRYTGHDLIHPSGFNL